MTIVPFTKMHGLGNDFVLLDERRMPIPIDPAWVARLADRHRGIGFDQLVVIDEDPELDAHVRFFNADGSESGACGNATRCVARLIHDETGQDRIELRTGRGILRAVRDGDAWSVDMGQPRFRWDEIPLTHECDTEQVPVDIAGLPRPFAVNMGNPHAVFVVEHLESLDVAGMGAMLERDPMFPERANIGFVQVLDRQNVRLRVFERGAGLTLACGSGACAAMVALVRKDLVDGKVRFQLDGGELQLAWDGINGVVMTGPTALSYTGEISAEMAPDAP
ncbi:diaminopimelate epimerase [Geminicoccus roseus]|uniref:diaminopimelate epimerase n=1 Tax=Geminicoccus roseus TaxID=404900 RepID=UPI000429D9D1|nr:diaminopimelate epimerase [Geminicoccus roseus]